MYSKKAGEMIPVLSVVDDGHGMSHIDVLRMLSLGHRKSCTNDPHHIGRFGVGFKVLLYTFHTTNLNGQRLFLCEANFQYACSILVGPIGSIRSVSKPWIRGL